MEDDAKTYLRAYGPGDLTAMYALDRLCFDPPFRFSRIAMQQFAEAPNALLRLACTEADGSAPEELLGFAIVHLEEQSGGLTGYVVTLDVSVRWRRRGLAQQLMQAVETAAAGAGAAEMRLHVFRENLGAIRLYERLGYSYLRTDPDFYGRTLHALVYGKLIAMPSSAGNGPEPVPSSEDRPEAESEDRLRPIGPLTEAS